MKITVEKVMALNPCYDYDRDSVRKLLSKCKRIGKLKALLTIPHNDARWILSRLLTTENVVIWAKACAERAKGYASNAASYASNASNASNASDAAGAAGYASYTASSASNASNASNAAGYASYTASYARHAASYACYAYYASFAAGYASNAEHELACEHALELIRKQR